MNSTIDYEARSARNVLIQTFSDMDIAKAWARENADQWPGMTLSEVIVTTARRVIWRPRNHLRLVGVAS